VWGEGKGREEMRVSKALKTKEEKRKGEGRVGGGERREGEKGKRGKATR